MSQSRIQDYGSTVIAKTLKALAKSLSSPAVLEGFDFSVDAVNRMRVSPGAAITNEGVIIIESENKTLNITPTSSPADYTIYYYHVDQDISGGVPAELTMAVGLLTPEVVSGVILGYVRYPGGAIPLDISHFIQAEPVQMGMRVPTVASQELLIPIRNQGYMTTAASGGAITLSDTWDTSGPVPSMYLKVRNNSVSTGSLTLTFPFKVKDYPYARLQLRASAEINSTITPIFIDSLGVTTTLLSTPITSTSGISLFSVDLPKVSNQYENQLVYLQLMMSLQASREIRIQALGLTEYNLPV